MTTAHTKSHSLFPGSSRRNFLQSAAKAALSALVLLGGESLAFGQEGKRKGEERQPQPSGEKSQNSAAGKPFQLTRSTFTPHTTESFLVRLNGEEIYLQLVEIADLKRDNVSKALQHKLDDAAFKAKWQEESFSLLFRSINETLLWQKTWKLEHDTLGTIELFLVPVDRPVGPWHFYEAVFNRLQ